MLLKSVIYHLLYDTCRPSILSLNYLDDVKLCVELEEDRRE